MLPSWCFEARIGLPPPQDVLDVFIPLDQLKQKHKGFAFVEFELQEDAAAAIENMNGAELFGVGPSDPAPQTPRGEGGGGRTKRPPQGRISSVIGAKLHTFFNPN